MQAAAQSHLQRKGLHHMQAAAQSHPLATANTCSNPLNIHTMLPTVVQHEQQPCCSMFSLQVLSLGCCLQLTLHSNCCYQHEACPAAANGEQSDKGLSAQNSTQQHTKAQPGMSRHHRKADCKWHSTSPATADRPHAARTLQATKPQPLKPQRHQACPLQKSEVTCTPCPCATQHYAHASALTPAHTHVPPQPRISAFMVAPCPGCQPTCCCRCRGSCCAASRKRHTCFC